MKDYELRSIVLHQFYNVRNSINGGTDLKSEISDLSDREFNRVCDQLSEYGMLKIWFHPIDGRISCSITGKGSDVIEGTRESPITITLNDSSVSVHNSSNVQVGAGNLINAGDNLSKIGKSIDASSASAAEKAEAKSLFSKLSNNATFGSIIGAIVSIYSTRAN